MPIVPISPRDISHDAHSASDHQLLPVITTTIYSGGASPSSTSSSGSGSSSKSDIPLGPVIGGAVGGFVLAVLVVAMWLWWGNCIRRKEKQQREEANEVLAVRANTRRNASSFSTPSPQYLPRSRVDSAERKVKFASRSNANEKVASSPLASPPITAPPAAALANDNDREEIDEKTSQTPPRKASPPPPSATSRLLLTRKPKSPSKLSSSTVALSTPLSSMTILTNTTRTSMTTPSPPESPFHDSSEGPALPLPTSTSSITDKPAFAPNHPRPSPTQADVTADYPFLREVPGRSSQYSYHHQVRAPGALSHKPSAVSSDSWYSTQSGEERRNVGTGPRRLFGNMIPKKFDPNRLSSLTRNSRNSTGSVYSTLD